MYTQQIKKVYEGGSILFFVSAFFFVTVSYAFGAAPYTPLIGLPGITNMETATLPQYVNAVYITLIGLGSLIAVMRIAWIGTKYSLSESVVHKVDAKSEITGVLTGLAILLIPFIVLNTINPELTSLDVLQRAEKIELSDTPILNAPSPTATTYNPVLGGDGCTALSGTVNTGSQPLCNIPKHSTNPLTPQTCESLQGAYSMDGSCNNIPLRGTTAAAPGGGTAPAASPTQTTIPCADFDLSSGQTCSSFCSSTLKGTYAASGQTCTYNNT